MAADNGNAVATPGDDADANFAPDPFAEGRRPEPQRHKVARSSPGNDVLNTIDLFGERSFSV